MDEEPIITGEEAPPAPPEAPMPPAEPVPAEAPQDAPAPAKSGGGKGMMIAIAVIAVVAIVVIAFMFMGGGGIEGKWVMESAEVLNEDGTVNQEASDSFDDSSNDPWMEFKSDGTVVSGDASGINDDGGGTWKTDGDQLSITSSYEVPNPVYNTTTGVIDSWDNTTETTTMTFTYSQSGNTLILEYETFGMKIKTTAKRA